jgi:hypothetical protein
VLLLKLNLKSSPGNITRTQEFQTLYFLVGMASEARTEKNSKIYWISNIKRNVVLKYNIIQLLSFDEVNVWIYWLLKKKNDIHWARKGQSEYHFVFKRQLIHTFTESKDSNCFILYVEDIVVFWNKKLHVHCPDVVLHYCLHHHVIIWIFII